MFTKKKLAGLAGVLAVSAFTFPAFATTCPVNGQGFQTAGSPTCIAPQGADGAGTGLQDKLDGMTTNPGDIDVVNDQHSPSAYWSVGSTGLSENKFVFEIAGNAAVNAFGIFDPNDPTNTLELFTGGATSGWSTQLYVSGNGTYIATYFDANHIIQGQQTGTFSTANQFGYYLGTPLGAFYSDASLNEASSLYPGGMHHMVTYVGDGSTSLTIGGFTGAFLSNEYLLAWEDTPWGSSDLDYNDMLILVESVHPVPEPTALGMFGLGVLLVGGFAALRRRRGFNA